MAFRERSTPPHTGEISKTWLHIPYVKHNFKQAQIDIWAIIKITKSSKGLVVLTM
uniref:Uncharacterized protein n=2 Tax=Vibrio cholerae TaxID=666 RepID=A0A0S2SRW6_VIBCL|nr:hypothetical protein [Vibrio cholerae O1]ALP44362.1 hypothetical protein [Vibrio cholerae]UWJ08494.1 hypothetical protein [Proteus mirabilis]ALP44449.1 hypothetical protein [Vibrio cholerae]ALP44543.1 hypothetical protein [Vibrio cholerae]